MKRWCGLYNLISLNELFTQSSQNEHQPRYRLKGKKILNFTWLYKKVWPLPAKTSTWAWFSCRFWLTQFVTWNSIFLRQSIFGSLQRFEFSSQCWGSSEEVNQNSDSNMFVVKRMQRTDRVSKNSIVFDREYEPVEKEERGRRRVSESHDFHESKLNINTKQWRYSKHTDCGWHT